MMLPLLPPDLITIEVVNMIFGRWSAAFPDRAADCAKLQGGALKNYVGPRARFPVELWCVCGRSIRTNNAAESSHAVLNASVRVSGAVSLDMFLFAIEGQMLHTRREIEAGCPSHTKAIYARRNSLLAQELSDLFNGRQGVFGFLDHCAAVMNIKNLAMVESFTNHRNSQLGEPDEARWIERNRFLMTRAATNLYRTLWPHFPQPPAEILSTVQAWAFQPESSDVDLGIVAEDSTLSFAGPSVHESWVDTQRGLFGLRDLSDTASTVLAQPLPPVPARPANLVHEGQSYRLVIQALE